MSDWNWSLDGWIVLAGMLSAVSCALPGNYLVLRRQSLMGDAISHAVLPGLVIAFLLSASRAPLPMFIGAVIVGVLTAVFTQFITARGKVEEGAAMGVVFAILFAIGLVLIRQFAENVDLDPGCVLYGSLENIGLSVAGASELPDRVVNLILALALNVVFLSLFHKELKLSTFDAELATTLGISARLMHYLLMVVVAITTVANFEAVGSILVIAMLIAPAAAAHLLTDRLWLMIVLSAVIAIVSAAGGHVLAIVLPRWCGLGDRVALNSAATMAVVAGGCYALALLFSPSHGLVAKLAHRVAVAVQIVAEDILGLLYRWQERYPKGAQPMRRRDVLAAVGGRVLARGALWWLHRRGDIHLLSEQGEPAVDLAPAGRQRAAQILRSHRLWEAYLDRHFALPADHLHAGAERVEHFITPEMRSALANDVSDRTTDPHGKPIPKEVAE